MNSEDYALRARALDMYANWIETGDVLLSAGDAASQKKKPKWLNPEQIKLVTTLRKLSAADMGIADVGYNPH